MNIRILQGCIKLINSDSKDIYSGKKNFLIHIYIFLTFYSSANQEKLYYGRHKHIKLHNSFQHANNK